MNELRKPIVLFLPTLRDTLSAPELRRDAARVLHFWQGEVKVWLLPQLTEAIHWYEESGHVQYRVLGVPAEHLDRLDIYHIGSNGSVWGLEERLPRRGVEGVLDAWLNLYCSKAPPTLYPAREKTSLQVPEVRMPDGSLRYVGCEVQLQPAANLPIDTLNENPNSTWFQWPPEGKPMTISLEEESSEYYGSFERVSDGRLPTTISRRDPNLTGIHLECRFPKPFNKMLPYGGSLDTLIGQSQIRDLAVRSSISSISLLQEAKDAAASYLTEGTATTELAWFYPLLQKEGSRLALDAAWFRFNLGEARSIETAIESPAWREKMLEQVQVRRAWGVLGLFWSLLIDRLESARQFKFCQRCGSSMDGRKDKQFCGRKNNICCYRARRSADKLMERRSKGSRSNAQCC
jgi:hypothetical protein